MFRRLATAAVSRRAAVAATSALLTPAMTATPARHFARATPVLRDAATAFDDIGVAHVQGQAPGFTADAVVNGAIKKVSLEDYAGKYVVLFFYPLDFTFVCPTEIIAFSDRAAEFEALGAQVLAVSVDSVFCHKAWIDTPRKKGGLGEMKIPVVADITKNIARDYGVLIEERGIALRGLFIIDKKGVIRSMTVNDLPVGRSVDETLRVLQAFQYADENGEVVPCNWKPGKPTINTSKAGEYFEKNN